MVLPFYLETRAMKVARGSRKQFNALVKETMQELGSYFHATMRDDRFTRTHAAIAKYAPRKPGYLKTKQRVHKHQRPLEYSGRSRRAARVATIRAGGNAQKGTQQVEVKYPGLRVFNFKHPNSQVDMVAEFSFLTNREQATLTRRYDIILQRLLDAHGFTTNRRGNLQLKS